METERDSLAWHAWLMTQAGWTRPTRTWLYQQAGLSQARRILEVGCGSGVISAELAHLYPGAAVSGVDVDAATLSEAARRAPAVAYVWSDAHMLPFPDGTFDAVVCHYLLLWLVDPAQGVREMARVTCRGGWVLACAEPDYGGRVDHPPEMAHLGQLQAEALRRQGADPQIGRRLGELFAAAGLTATLGVMAGQWSIPAAPGAEFDAEWAMREQDIADLLPAGELARLRALDRQALLEGRRVLFVPTFYALGKVA